MKMEKEEIFQTDVEREVETTDIVSHVSVLRERLAELQSATRQDPALCMLIKTIQSGWLEVCRKEVWSASLQLYFTFREELPIQNWLIFKAERIIIPVTGKTRVSFMQALHKSHTGLHGCLWRTQKVICLPGLHTDLEKFLSQCKPWRTFQKN